VHFENADTRRYRELWNMNETEITDLMRRVLQADKVIHEQQLGLHWYPPSEAIFRDGSADAEPPLGGALTASGVDDGDGDEAGGSALAQSQLDNGQIRSMLELLVNEAGFLVETKVRRRAARGATRLIASLFRPLSCHPPVVHPADFPPVIPAYVPRALAYLPSLSHAHHRAHRPDYLPPHAPLGCVRAGGQAARAAAAGRAVAAQDRLDPEGARRRERRRRREAPRLLPRRRGQPGAHPSQRRARARLHRLAIPRLLCFASLA
jgi:hypothetical protein